MNQQVPGDYILDARRFQLTGDFDEQAEEILQIVRLTRYQVENLRNLFSELQETLQKPWPKCQVIPFGSIVTGLGIQTSDVDCYVELPDIYKKHGEKHVISARKWLYKQSYCYKNIFAIINAKVPIVKFYHAPTQRHCDVSFTSIAGVKNTRLVAHLLQLNPLVLKLAVLIKYWSKVHNLCGTNLLANYALTLLVIFYLQQKLILPTVYSLQNDIEPERIGIWNMAFSSTQLDTPCNVPLYMLMGGFFQFYSRYNFREQMISIYSGASIKRDVFSKLENVPHHFYLYKENVKNGLCKPMKLDTNICVQDPFDHSRNCTVAVHAKLASRLHQCIDYTATAFEQEPSNNFFRRILLTAQPGPQSSHPPGKIMKRKLTKKKQTKNIINELLHGKKYKISKKSKQSNLR